MNEKVNYDGVKFGMLTVIKDGNGLYEGKVKRRSVICKCDCGNEREILLRQIQKGKQKSCGCLALPKTEFKEGDKFGYWTVIKPDSESYVSPGGHKSTTCEVECVCGKVKTINKTTLKNGKTNSCGCQGKPRVEKIKKEKVIPTDTEEEKWKQSVNYPKYYISTLGRLFNFESQTYIKQKNVHEVKRGNNIHIKDEMYRTFIGDFNEDFQVVGELELSTLKLKHVKYKKELIGRYNLMLRRCNNTKDKSYVSYGAKGIKVEESFDTFDKFYNWCINNGYKKDLEIDRIDSTKGYCESNCRFVTKEENNLKTLGLSLEDVKFIRSNLFNWDLHRSDYKCSDYTLKNIINYSSFKKI